MSSKKRRIDPDLEGDRNNDSRSPYPSDSKTQDSFRRRDYFVTINNPCDKVYETLDSWMNDDKVVIMSCQEERGKEGTLHIQGYLEFKNQMKRQNLFKQLGQEFYAVAPQNKHAAKQYCQKAETSCGQQWIKEPEKPVKKEVKDKFDYSIAAQWQLDIIELVQQEPDDRKIYWYWENEGQCGKSRLAKHLHMKFNAFVTGGKCADVMCGLAQRKEPPEIVVWDMPRSVEQSISYHAIEQIKNGLVYSTKYESCTICFNEPHVIIFANTPPDLSKLSRDRWVVHEISS